MTTTLSKKSTQHSSALIGAIKRWEVQLIFLLILAGLVNSVLSPYFLKVNNLFDMTFSFTEKGIVALAMAFIIISGNIDLSVASNMAMSAVAMAYSFEAGLNIWVAVLIGLLVGSLGGLVNGLMVAKIKLPSLVVTLGTFALYRGLAFSILGDLSVKGFPAAFTYLGQGYIPGTPIPFPLVFFAVLAVIFGLLLHRTTFGRFIYAIGQNEEACRFAGVRVDAIKIIIFTLAGLMSAVGGIILAARFGSVRPNLALGLELDIITAVVLGGVDIFGGSGSMIGVVLSLFLLGTVRFGMSLVNIRGQIQSIVVGSLLILSILAPQVMRQIQSSRRLSRRGGGSQKWAYILSGAALIGVAVLLVNFLWLRPASESNGPAAGSGGAAGVGEATYTPAPADTAAPVVLQPTNTPKPPPPTPTPRPTPTPQPTATPSPTSEAATETEATVEINTPTPTPIPRPNVPTIEIPAGPFEFGSDIFEPNETPAQQVELPAFYIDQFETTNAEFAQFVEATGYSTTAELAESNKNWRTYYEPGKDSHPVVKVSYVDAQAFCAWMGKRLPTEQEWEKAARGPDGSVYPWGDAWDSNRINGKLSGLRGTTAVGSYPTGASPYGVEDMAGNVWEWTASPYLAYPGSNYEDPFYSPDLRVLRGGGWFDEQKQVRASNRSAAAMDSANDDIGFRCAADTQ